MGRKIFITYKYADPGVQQIEGIYAATRARHYVDIIQARLDADDHINKGEEDGEDLSGFTDLTIRSRLRDKIYDSSITIALISKNMKDPSLTQDRQWIPWEIAYSLKRIRRGTMVSATNAMLAVVLPDENGSYDYFVKNICSNGCTRWGTDWAFDIIGNNMFNRKQPKTTSCLFHQDGSSLHTGNDHSYIYPVRWSHFISDINGYLNLATGINDYLEDYNIQKQPLLG